jgi:hypothetical protein
MPEEILNIELHTKILVMKALARKPNLTAAAEALGVSLRTLHRYKVAYKIRLVGEQYKIIDHKNQKNGKYKIS